MRGASKAMGIFFSFLGLEIPVPCWTTGRLWLPRLGLHKLSRPKEKADDWIWIIDHTVQLGAEKCPVILGIRQKNLPKGELHLRHADVEPIDLIPVNIVRNGTCFTGQAYSARISMTFLFIFSARRF